MTKIILIVANDHESNGPIEDANRTQRSYYNGIRMCDRCSAEDIIVGKYCISRKSRASNKSSVFKTLYSRSPRTIPEIFEQCSLPFLFKKHAQHAARHRVDKMLCTSVYGNDDILIGDSITIWRDSSEWLSPAHVTNVSPFSMKWFTTGT